MGTPPALITLEEDAAFPATLEANLLSDLREKSEQASNTQFALKLCAPTGATLGGLSASTSYGWLLIKVLFIEIDARRQGHGCALLTRAIEHAKGLGCHGVWLDTSNPDAQRFYLNQGFEVFGTLSNGPSETPKGHTRWFLRRTITSHAPPTPATPVQDGPL